MIEGTGRQTVGDGDEFDIVAGDAIWVPQGTLHSTSTTGWKPLRLPAGENPVWHQGGAKG